MHSWPPSPVCTASAAAELVRPYSFSSSWTARWNLVNSWWASPGSLSMQQLQTCLGHFGPASADLASLPSTPPRSCAVNRCPALLGGIPPSAAASSPVPVLALLAAVAGRLRPLSAALPSEEHTSE